MLFSVAFLCYSLARLFLASRGNRDETNYHTRWHGDEKKMTPAKNSHDATMRPLPRPPTTAALFRDKTTTMIPGLSRVIPQVYRR